MMMMIWWLKRMRTVRVRYFTVRVLSELGPIRHRGRTISYHQRLRDDFNIAGANILWEQAYALAEFLFIEILAGDVC